MEIRRLHPGAEEELMRASHLMDEPPDPSAVRAYLADEANLFLLAYDDGRAIGFLRGTELRQLKSERRQMFLYEIGVDEAHRRRSVGGRLIKTLLQLCRARALEEAFVFTDPANVAAVNLYVSTGAITETPADRMFVYKLGTGNGAGPPP